VSATETERYLQQLGQSSFLSLWSYGNPYTAEGRRGRNGAGKELCDLLVVFGDHLLLFSDKKVSFNEDCDIPIAWQRWYRRAISKSANQLLGAESWIRRFPDQVFLDKYCTSALPARIAISATSQVHRICVANGAYRACHQFFGSSGIGSLVINSALKGDEQHTLPFHVGDIRPKHGFVHVFDEFSLDAVFHELDTADDFIRYLNRREIFLRAESPEIIAAGEEQLLALYLTSVDEEGEHNFVLPSHPDEAPPDHVSIDESFWPSMLQNPQYLRKKDEDDKSRAWDRLIEHFIELGDRDLGEDGDFEEALRLVASEPRLRRRQIADALLGILNKTPPDNLGVRVVYSHDFPDRGYVFLLLPVLPNQSYPDYRHNRRMLLEAYCTVAKLRCPDAKFIIGFAAEPKGSNGSSEDLLAIDVSEWGSERDAHARQLQSDAGLLLDDNVRTGGGRTVEYPGVPDDIGQPRKGSAMPARPKLKKNNKRKMQKMSRKKNRRKK
jgi:hypothetical protein